jgi:hypothetical protein
MSVSLSPEDDREAASWIGDGQKYALVALGVKVEEHIPFAQLAPNLWIAGDTNFKIPSYWREWLGTVRAEEVEDFNLFLISKIVSKTPEILDGENQILRQNVLHFYIGLLLASPFAASHRPVMLTGSRIDGELGVRSQEDWDTPVPSPVFYYPVLTKSEIEYAARLAAALEAASGKQGFSRWRLFRTISLYREARSISDNLDRLHQYCRCIEGLILPSPGDTRKQFKSRTELFIGPRHHNLAGDMYDVRSAAEHLHEYRYLDPFDRNVRLDLLQKEAIAEYIARTSLAHILENPALIPHFANHQALARFWALPDADRRKMWGDPVDPNDALKEFDPRYISDGDLGGP